MAKYYPQPLSLLETAKLMGLDPKTHIRHFGQGTDDAPLHQINSGDLIQSLAKVN